MLQVVRDGTVVTLVLDDVPRKNAMTPELGDALREAVRSLASDAEVRAVVLTGAGGAFSAGGDLRMLERLRGVSRDESREFMRGFYARYLSILDLEVPTIAAVEGAAIGAGLCVALACDLCIVDES
ncbi:MAG: enoyl-CoA hydratase/isomerase family protein, partial [Chloroflexi bacterium]|nr:enoyl-CoA hydratase/isomerase family protein [Chloroflexota bacterium]